MIMHPVRRYTLFYFILLLLPQSSQAQEHVIGVLLSREIAPYVEMVEGLESALVNRRVQRFFLDRRGRPYTLVGHGDALHSEQFDVIVAVGPEALRYQQSRAGNVPLVYGMILNPAKVVSGRHPIPCGVSLNIPVQDQLLAIKRIFPDLSCLGVLFDPANNQSWYDRASQEAVQFGFELVPLQVHRLGGKLTMIGDFKIPEAVLFIPDKSIISRAVIQYVITRTALRKIPVIGYNQFFYDSGAAVTLTINYHTVGRQVAQLVEDILAGQSCLEWHVPAFETHVNDDVWKLLRKVDKTGSKVPGNPESRIQNPESRIQNPESRTQNPEPRTMNHEP